MDAAVSHRPETFGRSSSGSEAFAAIFLGAMDAARSNVEPAKSGDLEGIHELRVALRRLRAALRLFSSLLPSHPRGDLDRQLQQLGRCVGTARDWDVFATETLERARQSLGPQHHGTLHRYCAARRVSAHRDVHERLTRGDTAALFDRLAAFPAMADIATPRSDHQSLRRPIATLAPGLIQRLYRKTRRRGRHLRRADNDRLHALRKSIKTLRYGIEFLAPLYDQKATSRFLKLARKAQTELGRVNDAHGIPALTQSLTDDRETTHPLLQWARRDHRKARRKAIRAWRRLRRLDAFWRDSQSFTVGLEKPVQVQQEQVSEVENAINGNCSAARSRDAGDPS